MQALDLLSQAAHHVSLPRPPNGPQGAYQDFPIHLPATALSQSTGVRQRESDDEEGGDKKKRKRNRLALNCNECRRRKVKCDRNKPCEGCIRRGEPEKCAWDSEVPPQPFALNTNVRQLEARYRVLEDFVIARYRDTHPDLAGSLDTAAAAALPPPEPVASAPSPAPSVLARSTPKKTLTNVELETEEAATVIEDLAMSNLTYVNPASVPPRQASRRGPLKVGETSIFLENFCDENRCFFSANEVYRRIVEQLPPREVCDFLLKSTTNNIWLQGIVLTHIFFREVDEFWWALDQGLLNEVDPAFMASLMAALSCGLAMLDEEITHIQGRSVAEIEQQSVKWLAACNQCLDQSSWMVVPQHRVIQTIIFKWHPCMNEAANSYLWAAIAVRIAQALEFDQLGDDQYKMPLDSPGLPAGVCSLKRQLACRLWHQLVFIDGMSAFKSGIFQIRSEADYTTAEPLAVDEADLGTHIVVKPRPMINYSSSMPDGTLPMMRSRFATCMRSFAQSALALMRNPPAKPYERLHEIDAKFRKEIEPLLNINVGDDVRKLSYIWVDKAEIWPQCIERLHPRYAFSTRTSVECARLCIAATEGVTNRKLWFVVLHVLGAIIVLFQHIWLTERQSGRLISIEDFRAEIAAAQAFFEYQQTSRSNMCRWAAAQASRSTRALEESFRQRQSGHIVGTPHETFAQILRKVADESASSNNTPSPFPPAPNGSTSSAPRVSTPAIKPMDLSFLTSPAPVPPRLLPDIMGNVKTPGIPTDKEATTSFWDELLGLNPTSSLYGFAGSKSSGDEGFGEFDWAALIGGSAM